MEKKIIYHTAGMPKNLVSLDRLVNSGFSTVELDFTSTIDGKFVWEHDILPTSILSSKTKSIRERLSLEDVLDINRHRSKLMLDIKYVPRHILYSKDFEKLLEHLNSYDEMQIQSLDLGFLSKLADKKYKNIEPGLILNVITRGCINELGIPRIPDIGFMAISNELWEEKDGIYIVKCNEKYPDVKKYAWTWDRRIEDEERIQNFLDKGADGIITSSPKLVKSVLLKKD
jgi:glycerophosphoryl diester phosphodiesterase